LVLVPAGTFQQGSPESETGRLPNEGPRHSVTFPNPFLISKYEITNKQYRLFDPTHTSSKVLNTDLDGDRQPVVGITWSQAKDYCAWLTKQASMTFSLPTEAEWEYACRAGTDTRRYWGDDPDNNQTWKYANAADISSASAGLQFGNPFPNDDGFAGSSPVGSFLPNAYGIYDMMGNVWEWCEDWFGLYTADAAIDPSGPQRGYSKVIRGGSWQDGTDILRSAFRGGAPPDRARNYIGFRVVVRI
jgi:formylglycine-generating enzyme required for sulfatase activity